MFINKIFTFSHSEDLSFSQFSFPIFCGALKLKWQKNVNKFTKLKNFGNKKHLVNFLNLLKKEVPEIIDKVYSIFKYKYLRNQRNEANYPDKVIPKPLIPSINFRLHFKYDELKKKDVTYKLLIYHSMV